MKYVPLPTEFKELAGKVDFVQRVNANEYRSSCPECRDIGHSPRNGPPDRFISLINSRATGGPFGLCRRCGHKWWPGKDNGSAVDPETIKQLEAQAAARQRYEDEQRRAKLAEFSTHQIWKEYCERMQEQHQRWWLSQGVPLDAQTYLSLGYTAEKKYQVGDEKYISPAYTIPWFDGDEFLTMQYRLTNPVNPADKYRFEYGLGGGGSLFYRADPWDKIGDKVIVCEGAKKAIVTRFQLLPANTDFVVIAAASKGTIKPILDAVKDCGLVYIIFDPDGFMQARKLASDIGKAAHVVRLPYKVDDGFTRYGLGQRDFAGILDTVL